MAKSAIVSSLDSNVHLAVLLICAPPSSRTATGLINSYKSTQAACLIDCLFKMEKVGDIDGIDCNSLVSYKAEG